MSNNIGPNNGIGPNGSSAPVRRNPYKGRGRLLPGIWVRLAATFDDASVAKAKNPIFLTTRRQLLGTYYYAIDRHVRDNHGSVADDFLGNRLHVLEHVAKVAVYHGLTHSAFDLAVLYVVAVLGYA